MSCSITEPTFLRRAACGGFDFARLNLSGVCRRQQVRRSACFRGANMGRPPTPSGTVNPPGAVQVNEQEPYANQRQCEKRGRIGQKAQGFADHWPKLGNEQVMLRPFEHSCDRVPHMRGNRPGQQQPSRDPLPVPPHRKESTHGPVSESIRSVSEPPIAPRLGAPSPDVGQRCFTRKREKIFSTIVFFEPDRALARGAGPRRHSL